MLPVADKNLDATTRQIVLYSLTLIPLTLVPVMLGMAGWLYPAALLLGVCFCGFAVLCAAYRSRDSARQLFLASIVYLPRLLFAMLMDKV
jgi:protoheme IX farnesyltransferase